ncbi:MAG: caspase family protein [Bacteroidota bacterium]
MRHFLFLSCMLLSFLAVNAQTKQAFMVGIGNYEESGLDWHDISGDNDVIYLKDFLMAQGFKEKDIHLLRNQEATKQNVLDSLKRFTEKIKDSTSIVFLYFATHGQQITDKSGDEKEDQLDEAIILYDTPKSPEKVPNYEGDKHLLDDELQKIIYNIRKRLNKKGQLIMGVDACFSGTTDKGTYAPIRGTNKKFIFNDTIPTKKKDSSELKEFFPKEKKLGPFILLTASRADEINTQYNAELGSLTYALVNAFNEIKGAKEISYGYFFEKYLLESFDFLENISSQKPTIKGDIDETLFNTSDITATYPYFLTGYFPKDFRVDRERAMSLPYGKIHGVTEDVIFKIVYRANDSIVGYGKVITANETESKFSCNTSIKKEFLNNSLLIPVQLQYSVKPFKIQLLSDVKNVSDFLSEADMPLFVDSAEFQLELKNDSYTIKRGEEIIIESSSMETLANGLKYASYLQYLSDLDKKQQAKRKLSYYFRILTDDTTGMTILKNRKSASYFYNIATITSSFTVLYPNQEYRNDDLFISEKLGARSMPLQLDASAKKVLLMEQKKSNSYYIPNLNFHKSIFNNEYLYMDEILPENSIFPKIETRLLKPNKRLKLFIF